VRLAVAEAAGEGIATGRHAAALLGGTPGILHGSRSYMLQDADGQVIEAVSISAGLDYPGIGPQLAALMQAGRLIVSSATDVEAIAAVWQVARTEGILAAIESAHAVAALPDVLARTAAEASTGRGEALPREAVIVLGLSGRGDKDLAVLGLREVGR
jgi:tryptophan synthase beta chain